MWCLCMNSYGIVKLFYDYTFKKKNAGHWRQWLVDKLGNNLSFFPDIHGGEDRENGDRHDSRRERSLSLWKKVSKLSLKGFRTSRFSSVQSLSRVWLCDPRDCSTPGLPVLDHLPELAQTSVHWVGDAIQPSHPLSSPSTPLLNLSQHQGLIQWLSSRHQVAKGMEPQF